MEQTPTDRTWIDTVLRHRLYHERNVYKAIQSYGPDVPADQRRAVRRAVALLTTPKGA